MNEIVAVAPGKLLLLGEYAVLVGATAWVAAVDRSVETRLIPIREGPSWIDAPQLGIGRAPLNWSGDGLAISSDVAARLGMTSRFLAKALDRLGMSGAELAGYGIRIDSGALFETANRQPIKLGLGSSAAVAASLISALECLAGAPPDDSVEERLRRWLPVYRDALGSAASGADLAASLGGGLQAYRNADDGPALRPLRWPEGLFWQPVWVGRAAQTTDFVAAFSRWRETRPIEAGILLRTLADFSAPEGDMGAERWLASASDFFECLHQLGERIGRPIVTPEHEGLGLDADRCGVVYKSCGAGGGDLGVALATDPERLRAFARLAEGRGAHPLELRVAEHGARAFAQSGSVPID